MLGKFFLFFKVRIMKLNKNNVIIVAGVLCMASGLLVAKTEDEKTNVDIDSAMVLSASPEYPVKYFDMDQLTRKSKQGVQKVKEFEKMAAAREAEVKAKGEKLQAEVTEYREKAMTMSEASRGKKEKELAKQERELREFAEEVYRELEEQRMMMAQAVMADITKIVMEEAERTQTVLIEVNSGRVFCPMESVRCDNDLVAAWDKAFEAQMDADTATA